MNRNFERGNSRKTGKRGLRKFWKVCAWGLSISMILGAGNVGSYIVTADDGEAQTAEIPAETSEPETETSEEPVFSVSPESTPSPEAAGYTVTEMTPAPTESTQPSESPVETAAPEPSAISTISPETAAPEPSAESTVLPETAEPVSSPVTTEAPASMPEMSFEQKEKTTGITVSVKAEAGTFPEGTTMELSPVEDPSILEDAKQASELQNPSAVAVDITFRNTDGTVIEPQKQIRVTMTSEVIRQAESVDVVHVPDQDTLRFEPWLTTGLISTGMKRTPTLKADLFGDWREELILTDEENHIVIVRTLSPTEYGIRCLMHDPWYRNSAANQNICYNQVGFASFYLGDEAPLPAKRTDLRFE